MSVFGKRVGAHLRPFANALIGVSAVIFCAVILLAFPSSAHALEVQYRLTDVNGVEITDGYTGDAETLQQGLELTFEAWEYTGNEAYESSKPLSLYEPYGPLYGAYFARLGVTCVDDGSSVISVDNGWGIAAGAAFFYSGTYYSPMWYGRVFYPDSGVFIGGRTYRVDITFARENDDHGGFNHAPVIEQTISLSFGTNACRHANAEYVNGYDATCTVDGYTGDLVCMDCGEVVEVGQVIPALGHDEQWQVVREATEDAPGLEQLVCMRDGEVLQEREIPKLAPSGGTTEPSASSGGSGSNPDDHDQKADAGVGSKGAADTKDGPAQAAAPSGGSAASSDKSPNAQAQATGGAAATSSSTGGGAQATSAGAESDVSRVGARTDASASAGSASSDDSASQRVAGNVYRVLGGAAANGESDEDSDDAANEDESQSAALDIQVVGFPILWVLMWASLPTAFAWGLARRYGRNAIGVRRPSRLALFERRVSSEQMRHRYQVPASHHR